jgi:broad specificity phosphatase PhoE
MLHSTSLRDTAAGSHNGTGQVLWLVRHGESTWNARGLAQGHDDQARLTSRGLRQARAVAIQLRDRPIRALYSSDWAGDVAVVAHGGTLRMMSAYRRGVPVDQMTWEPLANASIVRSPTGWPPRSQENRREENR